MKFVILMLFVTLIQCQTPPRYPTEFSSGVDIVTSTDRHDEHEVMVGRLFFDQGQKAIRFDGHRHHTRVVTIDRFDVGKQYVFEKEDRGEWNCTEKDITNEFPLPSFENFDFVEKRNWRGIDVAVWESKTAASTARYMDREDNENPVKFHSETKHDGRTFEDFVEYYEFDNGSQDPDLFNVTYSFPDVKCTPAKPVGEHTEVVEKYTLEPAICHHTATCAEHFASCGCPYVWGGNACGCSGHGGFDCSGIVHHCYIKAGWNGIARTSAAQARQGTGCGSCRPDNHGSCHKGDLFFYNFGGGAIEHVVMYIGDGKVAECPHTGENCHVISPYMNSYVTCRRHC